MSRYVANLPRAALVRLTAPLKAEEAEPRDRDTVFVRERVLARFDLDLSGFLNQLRREELEILAARERLHDGGSVAELRLRLWTHGAALEIGGVDGVGVPWQPLPILLGGKLVHLGPIRGLHPPASELPRQVPPARPIPALAAEPEQLEALLERATSLCGVRLGAAGRDKGAFGSRIAALLGIVESGVSEPDWRGDVEVKTVPVIRDRSGFWRVKEDPAISMEGARPLLKLQRVLWIARVADADDSPILAWYYQEWDRDIDRSVRRHLHRRPKGPKGTSQKGWYLRKHFFTESGFLRVLNG